MSVAVDGGAGPGAAAAANGADATAQFVKDECVLAFHGPMLYEAKIQDIRDDEEDGRSYLLHYRGWSTKWDEWVGSDRIVKHTPENEQRAKQLKARVVKSKDSPSTSAKDVASDAAGANKRKGLVGSVSGSNSSPAASPSGRGVAAGAPGAKPQGKRVKPNSETPSSPSTSSSSSSSVSQEEDDDDSADGAVFSSEDAGVALKLKLLAPLKKILISDWQHITARQALLTLPRRPSVADILADYVALPGRTQQSQEQVEEVVAGLKQLFDRALPTVLLYRFERPQFLEVTKLSDVASTTAPSQIYGAEHLLRLFVKLPSILMSSNIGRPEREVLQSRINEFLRWLQGRQDCFTDAYLPTDKEYRKQVAGI